MQRPVLPIVLGRQEPEETELIESKALLAYYAVVPGAGDGMCLRYCIR